MKYCFITTLEIVLLINEKIRMAYFQGYEKVLYSYEFSKLREMLEIL